jgi:hypothetical protein
VNGSGWAHLIKTKLSDLKTFQFYFSYNLKQPDATKDLDLLIDKFRNPFWLYEKKWIITCDYVLLSKTVNFYTTPLSTMDFEECSPSNKLCQSSLFTMRFYSTPTDIDPHPIVYLLHNTKVGMKTCVSSESYFAQQRNVEN